jgi:hypothetical protein
LATVDEAEHVAQVEALIGRIDVAAQHVLDAAHDLSNAVEAADGRDHRRAGPKARRLMNLGQYADVTADSVIAWTTRAYAIYAKWPTGPWRRRWQRRRLLDIAKYLERVAARLEASRP